MLIFAKKQHATMKQFFSTLLLVLVAMTGWAQQKVWNNVVTGHANVPYFKVTKVAIYDDRTEVFLRLEVPQQMAKWISRSSSSLSPRIHI